MVHRIAAEQDLPLHPKRIAYIIINSIFNNNYYKMSLSIILLSNKLSQHYYRLLNEDQGVVQKVRVLDQNDPVQDWRKDYYVCHGGDGDANLHT
jgi:hypothetical protein